MKEPKFTVVEYPVLFDELSWYIGDLRNLYSKAMNEAAPEFKRGDQSENVNPMGVLGEMVMHKYLTDKGVKFSADPFIGVVGKGADLIIGSDHVDVKTSRPDAPDFLVNEKAHNKTGKKVTHYCFVKKLSPGWVVFIVLPYGVIGKWNVKDCKYSNAYALPVSEAKKLYGDWE